jgi:hypothetical protein
MSKLKLTDPRPVCTCIGCGCNDFNACFDEVALDACHWIRLDTSMALGVCSACPDDAKRWDAGDRIVAVPTDPRD